MILSVARSHLSDQADRTYDTTTSIKANVGGCSPLPDQADRKTKSAEESREPVLAFHCSSCPFKLPVQIVSLAPLDMTSTASVCAVKVKRYSNQGREGRGSRACRGQHSLMLDSTPTRLNGREHKCRDQNQNRTRTLRAMHRGCVHLFCSNFMEEVWWSFLLRENREQIKTHITTVPLPLPPLITSKTKFLLPEATLLSRSTLGYIATTPPQEKGEKKRQAFCWALLFSLS